jgi:ankyrin repeat protein
MSLSIKELLHENDFDINAKDDQSRTPLHLAAREADGRDLRVLLAMGADVTLRDERGDKPIDVLRRKPTIENINSDLNRLAEDSTPESDDNSNVGGDSGGYDGYDSYDSDDSDCGGSDDDDDAW